jgi:hypothetical protein
MARAIKLNKARTDTPQDEQTSGNRIEALSNAFVDPFAELFTRFEMWNRLS